MAEISSIKLPGGGTYDLKDKNAVPKYGMGKNLLRNWYFVGGGTGRGVFPVNQRGLNSYSGNVYTIDAYHGDSGASLALTQNGIQLSYSSGSLTSIYQYIENPTFLMGKKITLSILDSNGFHTASGTVPSSNPGSLTNIISINDTDIFRVRISSSGIISFVWISYTPSSSATKRTVYAVKLELGSEQTLAHQENSTWVLNEIPDYEYELYRCITSTADSTDTYANKSLATEQQLAYVETGTTASRNYTAGEYICWNGLTYTADTNIASGTTLSASGGNKNLTECVGGGINAVVKSTTKRIATETWGTIDETRSGNVVVFSFQGNGNTPPSSDRNRFLDYTVDITALARGVGIGTPGGANNLFMLVPNNSNLLRLYFGSSYQTWTDCSVTVICE